MTILFSQRLAIIFGILLPMVETVRRWSQLADLKMFTSWFDDYILGAALLYGAWRVSKDVAAGRRYLAAAWGLTCGMAYGSFFGQLTRLDQADPAPIPTHWVVAIKGVGFLLAIVALVNCLRADVSGAARDSAKRP